MKPVEQRLITLRRGVLACMDTPGRTGRFVQLPDEAEDVLVGGDLHGHMDNLRRLVQQADLVRHPRRHLVLQELIHGPFHYAQGGDKSHQLVEAALALMVQFPGRVHYLLGNHELAQRTRCKPLLTRNMHAMPHGAFLHPADS
ncbi:MAG: metallophosphoesterase, partial [Gemmataceae bacterium]